MNHDDTARASARAQRPTSSLPPLWLFALTLAAFATGTDDMVIAGILPAVSADLSVSEATAGQLVTVYSLAYGLGAPAMAILVARFARRPVLLTATILFTLTNIGMALAPSYPALMALRVVAALAAATITPTALATVAALAPPENKGRYLSLVTAGITVALVVGVPIGTWIGGFLGWRATMVFVALLGVLAIAGMTGLPRGERSSALTLREQFAPLRRPTILGVTVALVIGGAGGMMPYIYLAPVMRQFTGGGTEALGLAIMVFGVFGVVGVLLGGRGSDFWGPGFTVTASLGSTVAMMALLAVLGATFAKGALPFTAFVVIVVVWAVGIWALTPPLQSWLLRRSSGAEGAVLALQTSGMYLGFSLSGSLGGAVLATWGPATIPLVSATLLTVSGLGFLIAFTWLARRADRTVGTAEHTVPSAP